VKDRKQSNEAIATYLARHAHAMDFPLGGDLPIPLPEEVELLRVLTNKPPSEEDRLELSQGLEMSGAYGLVILSLRMAAWAVRTKNCSTLISGLNGIAAGGRAIDWRDLLGALSILEHCSNRLGMELQSVSSELRRLCEPELLEQIEDAYCRRPAELRTLATMGIEAHGPDEQIVFRIQDPSS
jgi:hypothetical protein